MYLFIYVFACIFMLRKRPLTLYVEKPRLNNEAD